MPFDSPMTRIQYVVPDVILNAETSGALAQTSVLELKIAVWASSVPGFPASSE